MTQPWLSIILPTYNGEVFLPTALDSVAAQQDNDIECIVVDDGSTDSTLWILERYMAKLPMRLIQRERRGSWVANTNYGLSYARGQYVCFLHQDDFWLKDRLNIMKDIIERYPEIGFHVHPSRFVDINNRWLGSWRCPLPSLPEIINSDRMIERLLVQNFISIPAPIIKRDILNRVGGLDESLWYTADWDLWLKIAAQCNVLYFPHALTAFRIHASSQTVTRSSNHQDIRGQLEKVFQNHWAAWKAPQTVKNKAQKIGVFSVEINTALAESFHGRKRNLAVLFFTFLLLGPDGWYRFLAYSRIFERATARLRAQLNSGQNKRYSE